MELLWVALSKYNHFANIRPNKVELTPYLTSNYGSYLFYNFPIM